MKRARLAVPSRIGSFAKLGLGAFATFSLGLAVGGMSAQATPQKQNPYHVVEQLGRVLVQVENHYVDPVERGKLLEGAIKGMVDNLDPHSSYLPAEEWKQFQADTEGNFGGVGIEVDGRGERLVVIAPIEGSPAFRAGIQSGDQIVGVDGEDIVGQPLDKVIKRMRGAPGSKLKLTIMRASGAPAEAPSDDAGAPKAPRSGSTFTVELTREIIHVAAIVAKLLDGNVAYVRIKQFQERTHAELIAATAKLRAEAKGDLAGVLLDVRSNPGGLVDEATEIADEFLASGGVYSMRHRGKIIEKLDARPGGAFTDLPVVALVNEWSASASELLVGALQDNGRATVVGSETFGKGSVQSVLALPNGAGLKLTTARYYTPSGHAIQADGIHPDVVIEPGTKGPAEPPRIVRERNLPGHLPAEGPDGKPAGQAEKPVQGPEAGRRVEVDAGAGEASPRVIGRDVPRDPSTSSDVALRVGYQLLTTKIRERAPLPR